MSPLVTVWIPRQRPKCCFSLSSRPCKGQEESLLGKPLVLCLAHLLLDGGCHPLLPALGMLRPQLDKAPSTLLWAGLGPDNPRGVSSLSYCVNRRGNQELATACSTGHPLAEPWSHCLALLCCGSQLCRMWGASGPSPWRGTGREGKAASSCLGPSRLEGSGVSCSVAMPPRGACWASAGCWHGGEDVAGLSSCGLLAPPVSGHDHAETEQRGSIRDVTSCW